MTAKLNQIIAIEKGIKSRTHSVTTELYKAAQKDVLFNGFDKKYQPNEDGGEQLPSETKRVQFTSDGVMRELERSMSELFTVTARKDFTNTVAKADVVIDGVTIVKDAPVSFLLFLEKQLTDIHSFATHMPVLDDAEKWTKDTATGLYKSEVVKTHRTKKVQKPIVMYDATDKHPAQTQLITEDVIVGFWHATKHSGAIAKADKQKLLDRVNTLLNAVKEAREEANMTEELTTEDVGAKVFDYLLAE